MNMQRWVDPRIQSVRVADVRQYLRDHGWNPKPYPRPELLVFEGPLDDESEPIIQIIPASEKSIDYRLRCVDLITSLSVLEDRHPVEVLQDILRQHALEPVEAGSESNGAGAAATSGTDAVPSQPPA